MNNLQVFNNSEFGKLEILIGEKGEVLFPATECAVILGYAKPHNAISRHCRWSLKRGVGVETGFKADGSPAFQTVEKTFIPESDLYRLIVRSKLKEAERFERWVFDEVLPTIRKHGAYMTPQKLDELLDDPDTFIQLLTNLKKEREGRLIAEQKINELQPKATYYDLVLQNKSLLSVSKIAKDYGMSATKLNRMLQVLGVQYKQGDIWLLYAKYQDKGYTQTSTYLLDDARSKISTKRTQKGRLFIYDLLKKNGVLPRIEVN